MDSDRTCCGCGYSCCRCGYDDFTVPESGFACEEFYPEPPEGDDEEFYPEPPEGDGEPMGSHDMSDDADALASAGFGMDEDYNHFDSIEDQWLDGSYEAE
jgi:hypothetical protein